MIGDDDLASFFDPEEFGCTVKLVEDGRDDRDVNGMWGVPIGIGRMQRASALRSAAQLRASPDERLLQLPNADAPADRTAVKVIDEEGNAYSITEIVPHGRLQKLLTLIPHGSRKARASDAKQNGWLPTQS
ncbi:hypothetical protein [Pseudomonas sp. MWU12-2345]|uniref:hypothetical protein n=1 Tax=Pseudomonas sp. MWU12-2345 TaxID=2928689 RepID=UPI00200F6DDF|nr:hypothetical protein [Pseudomonas sp. MWU12-2345]